jgi:hypothetical protein
MTDELGLKEGVETNGKSRRREDDEVEVEEEVECNVGGVDAMPAACAAGLLRW